MRTSEDEAAESGGKDGTWMQRLVLDYYAREVTFLRKVIDRMHKATVDGDVSVVAHHYQPPFAGGEKIGSLVVDGRVRILAPQIAEKIERFHELELKLYHGTVIKAQRRDGRLLEQVSAGDGDIREELREWILAATDVADKADAEMRGWLGLE